MDCNALNILYVIPLDKKGFAKLQILD